MTDERDHDQEYETTTLDEARCPDCGNEEGNTKTERATSKTKRIPPEHQVCCPECEWKALTNKDRSSPSGSSSSRGSRPRD